MATTGEDEGVQHKREPVEHTLSQGTYERSLDLHGWTISTSKRPISNSREIDNMSDRLTIPIPEMIFGNNFVSVCHIGASIDLRWTAYEALDSVDKNGTELKVSYSDDWNKTRDEHSEEIKHVTKPFDWTYTPNYTGHISASTTRKWQETNELLPLELLKRQDPILFYDDVILYESELDDNGTSLLSVRVRVMPERLLILSRFFMRLDDVIFRIRDTRVYVELQTMKILKEYLLREEKYSVVKDKIPKYQEDESGVLLNDANWVCQHCPIVDGTMEELI